MAGIVGQSEMPALITSLSFCVSVVDACDCVGLLTRCAYAERGSSSFTKIFSPNDVLIRCCIASHSFLLKMTKHEKACGHLS